MPEVIYGNKTIEYTFQEKEGLKSHYISVQKDSGVLLKGSSVKIEKQNALVLKSKMDIR